jgi:hypothetical protein
MKEVKGAHVKVGVIAELGVKPKLERGVDGGVRRADDKTVVEVAFWQEFGTKDIPARSFIRSTHDANRRKIPKMMGDLGRRVANGLPLRVALPRAGEWMKKRQIQKIDTLHTPKLKAATVKAKGSSKPLIDTAQMKQSVHYQVVIPRSRSGVGVR